jgi:signal transduction histidine kinase
METLIEALLGLASSETNVTDVEPVAVAPVAERSWDSVDAYEAVLYVETEAVIVADESRLAQLFENLFRNAVEHGSTSLRSTSSHEDAVEHGEDAITVTVGDLPDGFYVEDDGPGIPESERDAIFDTGYSSTDGGTGLGLSIVETIADAHGWTVDVGASESGGARFEFTDIQHTDTAA